MLRTSTLALLRRAASATPQQQHHMATSLVFRAGTNATMGFVRHPQAMSPILIVKSRRFGTHGDGDVMPSAMKGGSGGGHGTSAALEDLLARELQEEKDLMESEERAPELEDVSEKIHKRFHIKESPGSRCVHIWNLEIYWGFSIGIERSVGNFIHSLV